jgi:uracil-DNA glycosylase
MAFVIDTSVSSTPKYTTPRCGLCGLYLKCQSPKIPVQGKGKEQILVVGEAPGATEDLKNKPFVGKAGNFLRECLAEVGIDMWRDCWLTNSIICHPKHNTTPTSEQISYCHPNLARTIKKFQPRVIITVGRSAIESVLTGIWGEDIGPMSRWAGWRIPSRDLECFICPTYHPSFVLREMNGASKAGTPIKQIFLNHLAAGVDCTARLHKKSPKTKVRMELEATQIVHRLQEFIVRKKPIAFDYETSSLKPDRKGKIKSAAVSDGRNTLAFPWGGKAVSFWWEKLMRSDCPKIAHNLKFEDRWSKSQGIEVKNWLWCTMVGAHLMDNRRGICSLGFQAFVLLGEGDYSSHISGYLYQKSSYATNNVKDIPIQSLLRYNAKDALLTYLVAKKQRQYLKYSFPFL